MQRAYKELSTNLPWRRDICVKTHSACPQSDNESWCLPKLHEKVKKAIHKCNVCRLYSTEPFEAQVTAKLPSFRTEGNSPSEVTGLDFAGPLYYRVSKNENGKCCILKFTPTASRAIHLEVTKSQTAEEFQRKLNSFISRRSRPRLIISDIALTFKVTAEWVKKIRKGEILQTHLANEENVPVQSCEVPMVGRVLRKTH